MNFYSKGLSLLEILVVITVFAILGVIVTQSVALTLRGSKKSESQVKVRENVNYALSVMERQLRNADSIDACDSSNITYKDSLGNISTFACSGGAVASGSANLTSSDIIVSSCNFSCDLSTSLNRPSVSISLEANEADSQGIEGSEITVSTKVYLRSY